MNIDLDVSILEDTAEVYKKTSRSFISERETIKKQALTTSEGWDGSSYLAFLEGCNHLLSNVFSFGIDGIDEAGDTLEAVAEIAKKLQGRASSIGGILSGAKAALPPRLYYAGSDAESIFQVIDTAKEEISSITSTVLAAQEKVSFLETTSCDLMVSSLMTTASGKENKLDSVKEEIAQFQLGLTELASSITSMTALFDDPPGLVLSSSDLYSNGVLNLEKIRFLMGFPADMLTPTELAALANTLETIMGEVLSAEKETVFEEKLQLLTNFLECCYGDPVVGKGWGVDEYEIFGWKVPAEVAAVAYNFPLSPAFDKLANYVVEKAGREGTLEQLTLATWMQSIQYNASPLVQYSKKTDNSGNFKWDKPEIKIEMAVGGSFISTAFSNCDSGRTYYDFAEVLDTEKLRFASSVAGKSNKELLSGAVGADIYGTHAGEHLTPLDYLAYFVFDRETKGLGYSALKHIAKIKSVNGLVGVEAVCYVLYIDEYEKGLESRSDEYQQSLIGELGKVLSSESLNVSLNADGSLSVYQF